MNRLVIASSLFLTFLSGTGLQAQEGVAPGTVAAIARKTAASESRNWVFALGAMVSVTAGILLVSWSPGAKVHKSP